MSRPERVGIAPLDGPSRFRETCFFREEGPERVTSTPQSPTTTNRQEREREKERGERGESVRERARERERERERERATA